MSPGTLYMNFKMYIKFNSGVVNLSCVLVLIYMLFHYFDDGEIHVHIIQYMIVKRIYSHVFSFYQWYP